MSCPGTRYELQNNTTTPSIKPAKLEFIHLHITQEKDAKLVCSWLAVAFGVSDAKYHWAYSREMIRQAKRAAKGLATIEGVINSKDDVEPVWF